MSEQTIVWVMVAGGLITFLIRLSFIALEGKYRPPESFTRALPLVPVAALSALILPDLLVIGGSLQWSANPRLLAGAVAVAVAWRWKQPTLTIVAGFLTLIIIS